MVAAAQAHLTSLEQDPDFFSLLHRKPGVSTEGQGQQSGMLWWSE